MIPTWLTTTKLNFSLQIRNFYETHLVCSYHLLVIRSDTILAVFNPGDFQANILRKRKVYFSYLGSEARRGRIHESIWLVNKYM